MHARTQRARSPSVAVGVLALAIGACGRPPTPSGLDETTWALCVDELDVTERGCRSVASFRLPDALPTARGNRVADDVRAAALGRRIFFDEGFSVTPAVSCATCHRPELAFQDGLAVAEVVPGRPGARNGPSLWNAARLEGFFMWDGRADSLWSQPLYAFENPIEMATTRTAIARRIDGDASYRAEYEAVFGPLPSLDDDARFPREALPGDARWDTMSEDDRALVEEVAANVGKSLEAYMRRIVSGPSALDRYLAGDRDALTELQKQGLSRFIATGCDHCHFGPMLTDDLFHESTFGIDDDRGRAHGIELLLASPFSSVGRHFDADAGVALELPLGPTAADEHAFRTPSMRNVTLTAPYQHDGSRSLRQILEVRGILSRDGDEEAIEAFLRALEGTPPPVEWSSPPR